jgi:hypothetical protein
MVRFSLEWREALWSKFYMGAPPRQRRSVERYSGAAIGAAGHAGYRAAAVAGRVDPLPGRRKCGF